MESLRNPPSIPSLVVGLKAFTKVGKSSLLLWPLCPGGATREIYRDFHNNQVFHYGKIVKKFYGEQ
jgi:hypothetical protein